MTLDNELRYYEIQTSGKHAEPPESTPKKTQTFRDLKVLATTALLVEAGRHYRRLRSIGDTHIRNRNRNNFKR